MRCESAPPQSGDRPDGSLLGWDGTLGETGGFPDQRTLEIRLTMGILLGNLEEDTHQSKLTSVEK